MVESNRILFDRLTWARWLRAASSFVGSPDAGRRAKVLTAALLGLLLAINGLNVVNSYVGRDFMTAIEQRSMSRFVAMAALYVGVFAVSTVAAVLCRFAEERLGLLWRDWLTRRLVGLYLAGGTYYRLREQGEIANPDQRIADDVRVFTATTLSLVLMLLNGTFTILAFSGVMWSISPLLFGVAVAYAALGSVLTVLFGRPLIWLNYDQADREASLRADLVHVRENAESVALLRREGRIGARLQRRVDELVANAKRIIAREPQPRLLHDRLQLPDPDHPGADRRAAVHPRRGGVRRDHAVGDGVLAPARRVLADRHAVPVDLVLRGRARAAVGARREHRAGGAQAASGASRSTTADRSSRGEGLTLRSPRDGSALLAVAHVRGPVPARACW